MNLNASDFFLLLHCALAYALSGTDVGSAATDSLHSARYQ